MKSCKFFVVNNFAILYIYANKIYNVSNIYYKESKNKMQKSLLTKYQTITCITQFKFAFIVIYCV